MNVKNKSHSVTAQLVVPETAVSGVIATQGGMVGGWTLYAHEGRLKYCYNFFGIQHFMVTADQPIPAGEHQVRMEFAYDGGGLAKGGDVTLYYDGQPVGKGRVEITQPMAFRPTRRATSAPIPAHPPRPTTERQITSSPARSSGYRSTSAATGTTT